jgi:hypothetical protein
MDAGLTELKRFGYLGAEDIRGATDEQLQALVRRYTVTHLFVELAISIQSLIQSKDVAQEVLNRLSEVAVYTCDVVEEGK